MSPSRTTISTCPTSPAGTEPEYIPQVPARRPLPVPEVPQLLSPLTPVSPLQSRRTAKKSHLPAYSVDEPPPYSASATDADITTDHNRTTTSSTVDSPISPFTEKRPLPSPPDR
jgi:hypothetical protein